MDSITKTQEQILIFLLSNPEEQLTIRGIARRLNKSYTLVYNNLSELEKKEIIVKNSVPPAKIIRLNQYAPKEIFIDIELKKKNEFLKKQPGIKVMIEDILKTARTSFFIIIVFGSYAKSAETKNSDLDLLVIVQDKKDIKKIEDAIREAYTRVKKSLTLIDINDFMEMIKNTEELNIGNEAKKHHIILHGAEIYYQLLK